MTDVFSGFENVELSSRSRRAVRASEAPNISAAKRLGSRVRDCHSRQRARNGRFDDGRTEGSPRATNSTIRARSSPFSRALLLSPSYGRALSSSLSLRLSLPRAALVRAAVLGRRWRGEQSRDTRDFRGFTIGYLLHPRWPIRGANLPPLRRKPPRAKGVRARVRRIVSPIDRV